MPDSRRALVVAGSCSLALLVGCASEEPDVTNAPPPAPTANFVDVAADVGLDFTHFSGTTGDYLFPEILGSGVAVFDYDNDDDLDVYLVQGDFFDPAKTMGDALFPRETGDSLGNRLFQNQLTQTGELSFKDVTQTAGVGHQAYGMGAAVGDVDNDGDVDLYVTNYGANVLYQNNGDGTFTDITLIAGATVPNWSMSAAFFDLENDGDLDLYVVAYVTYTLDIDQRCTSANGNRDYCGPQNYQGARDYVLRNDGAGVFEDVSDALGVAAVRGPGLGVTAADFDADGFTDLFVANDGAANFVWMNRNGERFEEMGLMSGTAYNRDGSPEASMGVSAGDFDGDGDEDLFMTHLINETNTLYVNDGRGNFDDTTDQLGLGADSKAYTGFGTAWFDYNNDGWLDLYIANGDVKIEEQRESRGQYAFDQPNQLFHNTAGKAFREVSEGGAATRLSEISRGVAFGDLDRDGQIDFVLTNNSGPARVLLNRSGQGEAWVGLSLIGSETNRSAYGARVMIETADGVQRWRRVHSDGSYLSASDSALVIGLGSANDVSQVGVVWPSGRRERWANLAVRERHRLQEGQGQSWAARAP